MAFATAFQANAFQQNAFQIVSDVRQPGGWLPRKYVRKDGSISDTLDEPPEEVVTLEDLPANIALSPAILAALFMPRDQTPELMAEVRQAQRELRAIQRRMQEEEDIAVALLLMT
jgi:hypothetical protein